jgi:adenylate cyclase
MQVKSGEIRHYRNLVRRRLDDPSTIAVYRFGRSTLDVQRGVLLVDGAERRLRPKSFALLRFLVQNGGRLVSRDEIMRAVWPDVVVTDDSIAQCVKEIRRAIDDPDSRLLRTLPRRGYLFVAGPTPPEARTARTADPPLPDKPSIAVLPFQNMSGDPDQEYFADGTVEEITTALSRIRWLFVIARNSAFVYRGPAIDVKRVSRELGVRYVLEGSVRKGGANGKQRVRITAQLIDAISGAHIWADRYDRELNDLFAVQDDIANTVAAILEPTLAEAEQQRVLRKPPERLDTWETYQRGMWHFHKYGAESNQEAQRLFLRTIELDSSFAPGHYGYALTYLWEIWLYSTRGFLSGDGTALRETRAAVALDDKDGTARAMMALLTMVHGQWEAAVAEARVALSLNPNNAFVIAMLAVTLTADGKYAESIETFRRAMRASPHDPMMWLWVFWTGTAQLYARDFTHAVESLRESIRLRPAFDYPWFHIASALGHLGDLEGARAAIGHLRTRYPDRLPLFQERLPWVRPEDHALRLEGLRLALGETA